MDEIEHIDLSGVATESLVEQAGGGSFSARYINWARTLDLLRKHAPGWSPELIVNTKTETPLFQAPVGGYLMICLKHEDGRQTTPVVQAVTGNSNQPIPFEDITSADIVNTQVRGACKAAAWSFGLAYELWANCPLESGYSEGNGIPRDSGLPMRWRESESSKAKKRVESRPQDLPHEEERLPWHTHEVHFGKNKGKKLGELSKQSLSWYQEKWWSTCKHQDDPENIRLHEMCEMSLGNLPADHFEQQEAAEASSNDQEIPF